MFQSYTNRSSAKVTNLGNYTSAPSFIFMAWVFVFIGRSSLFHEDYSQDVPSHDCISCLISITIYSLSGYMYLTQCQSSVLSYQAAYSCFTSIGQDILSYQTAYSCFTTIGQDIQSYQAEYRYPTLYQS